MNHLDFTSKRSRFQFFLSDFTNFHIFMFMFLKQNLMHTIFMKEIDIRKIFGANVRYYRKKAGYSQEQLAEKLEISTNHISVIETGGKFVTYKLLEKIVAIFNVMPAALFYTSGTAPYDDTLQNKINSIIEEEMGVACKEISKKIANL